MWRLPNLVGRALHRFHSANVSSSLHAAPHTEVDVLNSSGLLPAGSSSSIKSFHSNSENGQNGSGRGREKTFRPFCRQLPQYCALDAIGWGAVAAAFLHLSKQITSPDSTPNPTTKERSFWPACLDGLVASVLRYQGHSPKWYILPNETRRTHLGEHQSGTPDRSYDVSSGPPSPGGSAHTEGQDSDSIPSEEEGLDFTGRSTSNSWSESEDNGSRQPCEGESRLGVSLEDAASQLQETSQNSTCVVLNIIGISSVRENGDYSTAVTCFQAAASRGYSKAQYNAGVCYEHGYGVRKDSEKAAVYYHLAAINGHRMAQYRYARYLLHHKVGVEAEESQQALKMLEQAAEAGLKEAQAYLGVFYTKISYMDPPKAVKYLRKAAESGDAQSRFHLGVCYESGFGVDLNLPEAIKHYEKAALEGHPASRERLSSIHQKQMEGVFLDEVIARVAPTVVLDLGTYCGYSAIRMLRLLPPGGKLYTVEQCREVADMAEEMILVAGFKNMQFQLLILSSEEAITTMKSSCRVDTFDLVLMDHNPGQYLNDLRALEEYELLTAGSTILANDAEGPGAAEFLQEVQNDRRYRVQSKCENLLEIVCIREPIISHA